MNKICGNCVKFKTQYCPCSIDCMATDNKPFYQDKRMLLDENTNLKQALNEIRKYIKSIENEPDADMYMRLGDYKEFKHILQIIDKVGGNE